MQIPPVVIGDILDGTCWRRFEKMKKEENSRRPRGGIEFEMTEEEEAEVLASGWSTPIGGIYDPSCDIHDPSFGVLA
jgi:hypothetical protein